MTGAVLALALSASLPVFGPGPLTNLSLRPYDDAAWTNASAHVAWSLAIPLAAEQVGGRKAKWIAGGTWIAWTLVNEAFLHNNAGGGPEVRTDLISRIVPCAVVLALDLIAHGSLGGT